MVPWHNIATVDVMRANVSDHRAKLFSLKHFLYTSVTDLSIMPKLNYTTQQFQLHQLRQF